MNEYTRREEVRWTFISSLCLVLFIAPAVVLLVTARGKTIPDPEARTAAKTALMAPAPRAATRSIFTPASCSARSTPAW